MIQRTFTLNSVKERHQLALNVGRVVIQEGLAVMAEVLRKIILQYTECYLRNL